MVIALPLLLQIPTPPPGMFAARRVPSPLLLAGQLPMHPCPELSPEGVVLALCRGLQQNNIPDDNAGLKRLFEFCTYECRAALTTRKGYKDPTGQRFVQHAEVWTLKGCRAFRFVGEPTVIQGTQTRGALATIAVDVDEVVGFRFASGYERTDRDACERADDIPVKTERYRFTLTQERRPPLTGCWLVKELMPMREFMMFNGDSGAVQG
jgi:hypothetical protein